MSDWGADPFGGSGIHQAEVELYTADFRVRGTMQTRFKRAAEIMNLVSSPHIVLDSARVTAFAEPDADFEADQLALNYEAILLAVVAGTETLPPPSPDVVIQKRRVPAEIAIPPFRVRGIVHITQGSRPIETLLNATDRFVPVTDAAISMTGRSDLDRSASVVAVQRASAQLVVVGDDENADELLADVLSEDTARDWLGSEPPG